jgi:hypothetical protein
MPTNLEDNLVIDPYRAVAAAYIQQLHRLAISIFRGKPGLASSPDRRGPPQTMNSPDTRQRMDGKATVGKDKN